MRERKPIDWVWLALLMGSILNAMPLTTVAKPKVQTVRIEISSKGYQPAHVRLRRGIPARVTFVRTTDATCVKEIVLPDFKIRRALPLNEPVVITFTPKRRGTFTFVCGMNMMSGQLIVQ